MLGDLARYYRYTKGLMGFGLSKPPTLIGSEEWLLAWSQSEIFPALRADYIMGVMAHSRSCPHCQARIKRWNQRLSRLRHQQRIISSSVLYSLMVHSGVTEGSYGGLPQGGTEPISQNETRQLRGLPQSLEEASSQDSISKQAVKATVQKSKLQRGLWAGYLAAIAFVGMLWGYLPKDFVTPGKEQPAYAMLQAGRSSDLGQISAPLREKFFKSLKTKPRPGQAQKTGKHVSGNSRGVAAKGRPSQPPVGTSQEADRQREQKRVKANAASFAQVRFSGQVGELEQAVQQLASDRQQFAGDHCNGCSEIFRRKVRHKYRHLKKMHEMFPKDKTLHLDLAIFSHILGLEEQKRYYLDTFFAERSLDYLEEEAAISRGERNQLG